MENMRIVGEGSFSQDTVKRVRCKAMVDGFLKDFYKLKKTYSKGYTNYYKVSKSKGVFQKTIKMMDLNLGYERESTFGYDFKCEMDFDNLDIKIIDNSIEDDELCEDKIIDIYNQCMKLIK